MTTLGFADRLRYLAMRARVAAVLIFVVLLIALVFAPAAGATGFA